MDTNKMALGIMQKMEKENLTLKQALGVGDKTLEEIYALAYAHYNQGKNKEALSLFHFLMNVDPAEFRFVFGAAATFHQMKDFANASMGFLTAWQLNPTDPKVPFYAADCLIHIGEKEHAKELLEITLELIEEFGGKETLKQRSLLTLKALSK